MILRLLATAALLLGAVVAGAISVTLWFAGAAGQLPVEFRVANLGLAAGFLGVAAGITALFRPAWGAGLGLASVALLAGAVLWGGPAAQQFARENAGRYNPAQFLDLLGTLALFGGVELLGAVLAWLGRPR